jgi:hypothetical protein
VTLRQRDRGTEGQRYCVEKRTVCADRQWGRQGVRERQGEAGRGRERAYLQTVVLRTIYNEL